MIASMKTRPTMMFGAAVLALLSTGCATKKYVKTTVGPVESRVGSVEKRTTEQAAASAGQANTAAGSAQQAADQTRGRLTEVVGNLDNYQHVTTESLFFAVNKSKLTPEEMQKLDDAVAKLQGNNNYVLEIQGFTDKTGSASYNVELGRRRAEEVVRYLTTKHQVPL